MLESELRNQIPMNARGGAGHYDQAPIWLSRKFRDRAAHLTHDQPAARDEVCSGSLTDNPSRSRRVRFPSNSRRQRAISLNPLSAQYLVKSTDLPLRLTQSDCGAGAA